MADLTTSYLGLKLRNPIVAGSSGLSASVEGVKALEQNGAGAVVLKSIFEEEIVMEHRDLLEQVAARGYDVDAYEYYDQQIRGDKLREYTALIAACKSSVSIPVIASVNCMYSHEWISFAKEIESAGTDALELNMFFMPSDLERSSAAQEQAYFDVVAKVRQQVDIPIALKVSYHFTNVGGMILRLSRTGVAGLVLFNRFYTPDIDTDALRLVSRNVLSTPAEQGIPLRWVAMMSGRVDCDLAGSTGIHDGDAVVKQILAGASAVQVVSALYKNGVGHLATMLAEVDAWMTRKGYYGLEQYKGQMSQKQSENPAAYERVQFMKYASGERSV
ncbi:MAG: dihydroorotate dehydrogenase-like protein [Anaerolineae bacterium]|nr:dihydroorotate dehydrogenase-like protein [Anaerolineae bacterium]